GQCRPQASQRNDALQGRRTKDFRLPHASSCHDMASNDIAQPPWLDIYDETSAGLMDCAIDLPENQAGQKHKAQSKSKNKKSHRIFVSMGL
ncbi:MAG: hypothetical protein AB7E55_24230, partial [Pigmentiphaga sp.]